MLITKPPHNRYALHCLDNYTYVKYATTYSGCKRWCILGIYSFQAGAGGWVVAREVTRGTVVQYGKRRLATVVIIGATYFCAPGVALITNLTRVVKSCKVIYTTIGYAMEAAEDLSHIPFVVLDFALFGQPIPANKDGRFSSWQNMTDISDNLPAIGDSQFECRGTLNVETDLLNDDILKLEVK